jgi:hypothetical protein
MLVFGLAASVPRSAVAEQTDPGGEPRLTTSPRRPDVPLTDDEVQAVRNELIPEPGAEHQGLVLLDYGAVLGHQVFGHLSSFDRPIWLTSKGRLLQPESPSIPPLLAEGLNRLHTQIAKDLSDGAGVSAQLDSSVLLPDNRRVDDWISAETSDEVVELDGMHWSGRLTAIVLLGTRGAQWQIKEEGTGKIVSPPSNHVIVLPWNPRIYSGEHRQLRRTPGWSYNAGSRGSSGRRAFWRAVLDFGKPTKAAVPGRR